MSQLPGSSADHDRYHLRDIANHDLRVFTDMEFDLCGWSSLQRRSTWSPKALPRLLLWYAHLLRGHLWAQRIVREQRRCLDRYRSHPILVPLLRLLRYCCKSLRFDSINIH